MVELEMEKKEVWKRIGFGFIGAFLITIMVDILHELKHFYFNYIATGGSSCAGFPIDVEIVYIFPNFKACMAFGGLPGWNQAVVVSLSMVIGIYLMWYSKEIVDIPLRMALLWGGAASWLQYLIYSTGWLDTAAPSGQYWTANDGAAIMNHFGIYGWIIPIFFMIIGSYVFYIRIKGSPEIGGTLFTINP